MINFFSSMVDEWSLKDSEELEDVFRLLKNLEEFI